MSHPWNRIIRKWFSASTTPVRRPIKPSVRPKLEVLEGRLLLDASTDTLIWNPQMGNNASAIANWFDETQNKQGVTAPTATNPVQLSGSKASYNQPIVIDQDISAASINVDNNYNSTLTINKLMGFTTNNNDLVAAGSTLTVVSNSTVGLMLNDGNSFTVQSGGTLNLTDPPGATGSTFFSINPKLVGYLSNAGTVNWKGTAAASGGNVVFDTLGTPVLNTGLFTVDGGTKGLSGYQSGQLFIMNSCGSTLWKTFYNNGGTFVFQNGALVGVNSGYYQSSGTLASDASSGCTLQSGLSSNLGDINIAGGIVQVDNQLGSVSTLNFVASTVEINGELVVEGLTTGGGSTQADQLNCGTATVTLGTGSTLSVGTTGRGDLGTGNTWTVLTYGTNNGGKDWTYQQLPPGMTENTGAKKTVVTN